MITIEYVKDMLGTPNISDSYAKKFIEYANGDVEMLNDILYLKKAERHTRPDISEVK